MRLLLANSHLDLVGGVQTYLRALVPALQARGHEVAYLHEFPSRSGSATAVHADAAVVRLCVREVGLATCLEMARIWAPDVVFVQGLASPELEHRLTLLRPSVLFAHAHYGTCATGHKLFRRFGHEICRRPLSPACLPLNFIRGCGVQSPLNLLRLYAIQARRKRLLTAYRAVAVPSRYLAEEMKRNGVAPDRISVTPLPPTELKPQPEPPLPRPPGDRILLAGRLTALKGADLLLEAVPLAEQRLGRRLSVTIMGDGPERLALERLARSRAVRCSFPGWLHGQQLKAAYCDADLLAIPSVIPESYGLSGLEAACFGTPTVAFDLGGVREWLEPNVGGVLALAPPATAISLAEAIVRALGDGDSFNRLRRGAWRAAHRFSMESHLEAIESVLASVART